MAGRGLDALAAAIGGFLRRAVALEGRRADALAVHAPADVPGAAAAVTAYLSRPAATGRRVPLPGAPGDPAPAGWLVLLGDRPASDLDTIAAERIAPLLSLELMLEAQVRRARDEAGRGDLLPSDGPPWVVLFARQSEPDDGGPTREEVRAELRFRFAARRLALRGTSESLELRAVAAPEPDDPDGTGIGERVADFLGRTVAVSRPVRRGRGAPRRRGDRAGDARGRGAAAGAAAGRARRPSAGVSPPRGLGQPARRSHPGRRAARAAVRRAPRRACASGSRRSGRSSITRGPARRPRRWESTATPSRTGSATSRPSPAGIWVTRTSGWPCRWPYE